MNGVRRLRRVVLVATISTLGLAALCTSALVLIQAYHPAPRFVSAHPHELWSSRVLEFNSAPPMISDTYLVHESFWQLAPAAEAEIGAATQKRRSWLPQVWFLRPAKAQAIFSVDMVPGRKLDHFYQLSREQTERDHPNAAG